MSSLYSYQKKKNPKSLKTSAFSLDNITHIQNQNCNYVATLIGLPKAVLSAKRTFQLALPVIPTTALVLAVVFIHIQSPGRNWPSSKLFWWGLVWVVFFPAGLLFTQLPSDLTVQFSTVAGTRHKAESS